MSWAIALSQVGAIAKLVVPASPALLRKELTPTCRHYAGQYLQQNPVHPNPMTKPKPADISSKRLVSLAPNPWAQWVTETDVQVRETVGSDFQWVERTGDVLLRAYSPEHGDFLIANEFQLRYNNDMPRRMRAYAALAEEKYKLPIYTVLVNILPVSSGEIASCYESEFMGQQARQDYRVINLWEVDVAIALDPPIPPLLPFVPVLKGGDEEATVRRALNLLRQDEQLSELETMLSFFARFVLDAELVNQIMRWDMAVLRESPWYQEILREGEQRGEQRGIEIGQQQGEQRGIEIGEQRGEQRGRQEEKLAVAMNLLNMGLTVEQIAQATGLTVEQVQQLQAEQE